LLALFPVLNTLLHTLPEALPEIIDALPPSTTTLSARAQRAIQKTYSDDTDAGILFDALRVYYATAAASIGRCIAPDCDVAAGSGAESLLQLWPQRRAKRLLQENCSRALDTISGDTEPRDLFRDFYQQLFPRDVRHANGEFYTPGWLIELVLDRADYRGESVALLDPACGSGGFLIHAARRLRNRRDLLSVISGFDTNPLAVLSARVNLLYALGPDAKNTATPPKVYLHDCVLDDNTFGRFPVIAGNPPWVLWDNLDATYSRNHEQAWRSYGLFNLTSREAQLGGGKKDLSMLVTYAAADKYLADGGRLVFILNQSIIHSRSGSGFRTFKLGADGPPLAAVHFDDLSATSPFDVRVRAAVLSIDKGRHTVYPVPYTVWTKTGDTLHPVEKLAQPRGGICGPWQITDEAQKEDPRNTPVPDAPVTPDYTARTGAFSGGANGVFWVSIIENRGGTALVHNLHSCSKHGIDQLTAEVESELLFPLLRWGGVSRWHAEPRGHILFVQEAETRKPIPEMFMQTSFPLAYRYLKHFETALRNRKSAIIRRMMQRTAFYTMFGIGPYTLSRWKVVWRRMDKEITAAVAGPADICGVEKPVIPQETLVFIACGDACEAHYLCALLNSPQATERILSISAPGGKSFGTAGSIAHLRLARFDHSNPTHLAIAELSEKAHVSESFRRIARQQIAEIVQRHMFTV